MVLFSAEGSNTEDQQDQSTRSRKTSGKGSGNVIRRRTSRTDVTNKPAVNKFRTVARVAVSARRWRRKQLEAAAERASAEETAVETRAIPSPLTANLSLETPQPQTEYVCLGSTITVLVWRSSYGVSYIDIVELRRART